MTQTRTALLAALLTALPTLAVAQTPAINVEIGQKVWIARANGPELRGDVTALSASTIDVTTTDGTKHIALDEVWTISKKDSNKSGFLIGAAIGAAFGVPAAEDYHRRYPKEPKPSVVGMCVVGAALYGGIGAWIDSRIEGREVVYARPAGRVAVHVTPLVDVVGPKRVGIGGTMTWR